ncbi:hypothetical protein [Halopseudomonas bauzanensis]|uniref:Uncharacterized protein n=1 Tax=Halopseudomonas bauzanensis TaxID=653930 RepID=A0A4U0YHG8_9GAMM|nr:hypothetical protein [Halopseudomonas bauzanensis]TKA91390.1 hypothetical protein FA869_09775 [Halopseudomonas bauzanensis]
MAARNRYVRFLAKQGSSAKVTRPGKPTGSSSKRKISLSYTGIVANISQVLMLVVVVYGYIYTVRPVFQKELVSEDLARLQIEQRKIQQQMDKQTETLAAGEARNKELAEQRSAIEAQVATLNQKVVDAEKLALDATRRAGQATAEAKTAESALSALQTQHYGLKLESLLGDVALPSGVVQFLSRSRSIYTLKVFEEAEANSIAQKLKSLELQPVDLAKTTLSQLKAEATTQARAPSAAVDALLARNYQEGLAKHADELICPTQAYADWQLAFQSAMQASEGNIQSCVREYWADRTTQEDWTPSDVRSLQKSDFWNEQERFYRVDCEVSYSYILNTAFRHAWEKADEPCDERRMLVNDIVMDAPIELKLKPMTVAAPPTTQDITQLFQNRNRKQAEVEL